MRFSPWKPFYLWNIRVSSIFRENFRALVAKSRVSCNVEIYKLEFRVLRYECSPRESLELESLFSRTGGAHISRIRTISRSCLHQTAPCNLSPWEWTSARLNLTFWSDACAMPSATQSLQPHEYVMPHTALLPRVYRIEIYRSQFKFPIEFTGNALGCAYSSWS